MIRRYQYRLRDPNTEGGGGDAANPPKIGAKTEADYFEVPTPDGRVEKLTRDGILARAKEAAALTKEVETLKAKTAAAVQEVRDQLTTDVKAMSTGDRAAFDRVCDAYGVSADKRVESWASIQAQLNPPAPKPAAKAEADEDGGFTGPLPDELLPVEYREMMQVVKAEFGDVKGFARHVRESRNLLQTEEAERGTSQVSEAIKAHPKLGALVKRRPGLLSNLPNMILPTVKALIANKMPAREAIVAAVAAKAAEYESTGAFDAPTERSVSVGEWLNSGGVGPAPKGYGNAPETERREWEMPTSGLTKPGAIAAIMKKMRESAEDLD